MVRGGVRLPSFCLSRVATRVRVRSSPKPISTSGAGDRSEPPACPGGAEKSWPGGGGGKQEAGRKVMVVVDSSNASRRALQWALSHAVQAPDTIVLLGVAKPRKQGGESQSAVDSRGHEPLLSMKNICQARKPGVEVEVCLVEGKERGPAIVEEAKKQGASLLVLGQKRRSLTWRLVMVWAGRGARAGCLVDYCIHNAGCLTLAVRKRSRRAGGYLITTRHHRDFWLLA